MHPNPQHDDMCPQRSMQRSRTSLRARNTYLCRLQLVGKEPGGPPVGPLSGEWGRSTGGSPFEQSGTDSSAVEPDRNADDLAQATLLGNRCGGGALPRSAAGAVLFLPGAQHASSLLVHFSQVAAYVSGIDEGTARNSPHHPLHARHGQRQKRNHSATEPDYPQRVSRHRARPSDPRHLVRYAVCAILTSNMTPTLNKSSMRNYWPTHAFNSPFNRWSCVGLEALRHDLVSLWLHSR